MPALRRETIMTPETESPPKIAAEAPIKRAWYHRLVLLWLRIRGKSRLFHNQCPACNSDAPAVDACPVCEGYDYTPHVTEYPPSNWRKMDWRNRYGSYVEYLYVENPPKLKWDGNQWINVRSEQKHEMTDNDHE